jgi:hypothetical protein
LTSGLPKDARFSIQITMLSRAGFGYARPTSRNVGEPLLDEANFVLATRPTRVATLPSRETAFCQLTAPWHVTAVEVRMSGRAVAGPVAITPAAIPAVITPMAKRDRFKVVPFVDGVMLTLVHPPTEVNVRREQRQ